MRKNLRPLILMQLGLVMVSSLLVPLFIGVWFDGNFGTAPFGVLIGMTIGVFSGTVGVWRLVSRAIDDATSRTDDTVDQ
ncbi:MAG: AtpZ/AtpI family protein [Chloroflexota bacterium]